MTAPFDPDEWERCAPWLQAALINGGDYYDLSDVEQAVRAGEALFWPGEKSAVVTQVWRFPKATILNFWLAGGDMTEIVDDMRPVIEAYGKVQGCTKTVVVGRLGWVRALKGAGYTPVWTAVAKEID